MPEFIKEYMGEEGAIMGMLLAPLQGSSHKTAATPCSDSTAPPLTNYLTPSLPLHFRDLITHAHSEMKKLSQF